LIAIVDDDEAIRLAAESLIRSLGFAARIFASAEAFLASDIVRKIDCLITDVQMPGMSGVAVAEKMKRINSHVPIMLLSGYDAPPKSKLGSVDRFLSKSQPPNILVSSVQELLGSRFKTFFGRWMDEWKLRNHLQNPGAIQ